MKAKELKKIFEKFTGQSVGRWIVSSIAEGETLEERMDQEASMEELAESLDYLARDVENGAFEIDRIFVGYEPATPVMAFEIRETEKSPRVFYHIEEVRND